jgi:hypothetical protein
MTTTQHDVFGPAAALGVDSVSGATIETSQNDYSPGEIVHVTGRGWAPNETVQLVMTEQPDMHDDVIQNVTADDAGGFSSHFYDVQVHDLGVVFTLVATGLSSGSSATATFTDGNFRVIHSAGMSDFNGGVRKWTGNNFCGGIADEISTGLNVTASISTTALAKTANNGQSLSFAVPATVGAHSFTGWTAGPGVVVVGGTSNPAGLCVVGFNDGSFTVTANYAASNTAPAVNAGEDATIPEGGTFAQNGSFTDPDANSWTATVDYGDGAGTQALTLAGKTFSLNRVFGDNGTYNVTVTVDDGTATATDVVVVTINNVAPLVDAGAGTTISEGGTFAGTGSFADPGADTWTATVNYGDGSPAQALALGASGTFDLSHVYADDGTFTVMVTVTDDDGDSDSGQATVVVNNVAPSIQSITVPTTPLAAGSAVDVAWNFTDPGADAWTCTISWDASRPPEPASYVTPKSCGASSTLTAGVYTVTVLVADDNGGSDHEVATTYIVVYDPSEGFVTGGGWIDSPAGAYVPDAALAGKATFGFVSRYEKGKTLPQGNTEFQFHAAGMNFKSTSYEMLVVAGTRAQYKGEGTLENLSGVYGFLLTATDGGNTSDGVNPDKFRIKIWNKATNAVIYDNQMGQLEDSDAATDLSGGSIVIHTKK